jgi:hypothetical protein
MWLDRATSSKVWPDENANFWPFNTNWLDAILSIPYGWDLNVEY